jgi:hypothetical protein
MLKNMALMRPLGDYKDGEQLAEPNPAGRLSKTE